MRLRRRRHHDAAVEATEGRGSPQAAELVTAALEAAKPQWSSGWPKLAADAAVVELKIDGLKKSVGADTAIMADAGSSQVVTGTQRRTPRRRLPA